MQLKTTLRSLVEQGLLSVGYPTSKLGNADTSVVLFYHGICGDGISAYDFEKQVEYLNTHFDLIFASEVARKTSSKRLRVAITFDDGLKNTKDVALPILQKLGIKATLFVLPCEVRWLWTAETRERLATALNSGVVLDGLAIQDEKDIDIFVEDLKAMPDGALQAVLERIRAQTSFEPSKEWLACNELMTAEELRSLPEDLIELGAHTIRHPILPQLDQAPLYDEIVGAKKRLEALLERPIKTFSYPNGDFDQRCLSLVEQHYDFAFTTECAIDRHPERATMKNHPHAINRMHGLECHADMPIKLYQFIKQGHDFMPATEPTSSDHHVDAVATSSH